MHNGNSARLGAGLAPTRSGSGHNYSSRKNVPLRPTAAEEAEEAAEEARRYAVRGMPTVEEARVAGDFTTLLGADGAPKHTPLGTNPETSLIGRSRISSAHSSAIAGKVRHPARCAGAVGRALTRSAQIPQSIVSRHVEAVAKAKYEGQPAPKLTLSNGLEPRRMPTRISSVVPQPGGLHKAMLKP